ncbi:MAG: response regulator [Chloroflexi bacterium]|nr:response regulator [Chloroflexota bacterium]
MDKTNLLLIEDNPGDARLIKEMLSDGTDGQYELDWKPDLSSGILRAGQGNVDVILLDLNLPDSAGYETFLKMLEKAPLVPIVVLSGISDESIALRAVRKGAQDYLVKGKVDTTQLIRSLRYAMARKAGEDRQFSLTELQTYDGKEGRQAYIAFEGKVYDVTTSRFWKGGAHIKQHFAGQDLTGLVAKAPHGAESLLKVRVVGVLVKEKSLAQKFLLHLEEHHPHSLVVHLSIAYGLCTPFFALLYLVTGELSFEKAAYYLLVLGLASAPFSTLSGVLSWRLTFEGTMNRLFGWKIALSAALFALTVPAVLWRALDPDVLVRANYLFLGLLIAQVPLAALLGYAGGKISHP